MNGKHGLARGWRTGAGIACMAVWGGVMMSAASASAAPFTAKQTVQLCDDDNYAPFAFNHQGVASGATADWIRTVFDRLGIRYRITLMPWARCLAYVRQGTFQIAMDAYYDSSRKGAFVYSKPFYTLTPQIYYSRKRYPDGLPVTTRNDLKQLHGCGLKGYSYANYGLQSSDLDTQSSDYATLIRKVEFGLCDYLLEEQEVMRANLLFASRLSGDIGLGHEDAPGAVAPQLHFLLTRSGAFASWMLPVLNQQIDLTERGGLMRMLVDQTLSAEH